MREPTWERWPLLAGSPKARAWLQFHVNVGLTNNTVDAYGRGLEEYLRFCASLGLGPELATRAHLASYVRHLLTRPKAGGGHLSNATVQQRLVAVRRYYDHIVEDGIREVNPVGRGRYTPGNSFGGQRGLLRRFRKLPWIPSDKQWIETLSAVRELRTRDRLMLALSYDAALRREELCGVATSDIDPSKRLLRVRAETTKGRQERMVPFSEPTASLYRTYLRERRSLSRRPGPLFLSESSRNKGNAITIWTWSKVTKTIANRSGVEGFTSHTLRHLCLTDLARAGWDLHENARFAGHRTLPLRCSTCT